MHIKIRAHKQTWQAVCVNELVSAVPTRRANEHTTTRALVEHPRRAVGGNPRRHDAVEPVALLARETGPPLSRKLLKLTIIIII